MRRFHQRPAGEDEQERRQEGEPGHQRGGHGTGDKRLIRPEDLKHVGADEPDEGDDHDQRTRGGFTKRQAVDHLRRRQPSIVTDRALIDIRQHRVGAAKGQQRGLGEEPGHLGQRAFPAEQCGEHGHGQCPQDRTDHGQARQFPAAETGVSGGWGVIVDHGRTEGLLRRAVATGPEFFRRQASTEKADDRRAEHDQRKRHIEHEDGHEGRGGDAP
ncbi:hypothetical protein D3C78_1235320 [compost metagenome]